MFKGEYKRGDLVKWFPGSSKGYGIVLSFNESLLEIFWFKRRRKVWTHRFYIQKAS
jgi:hypothetical protein